ncbi:MAG: hypothetical protein Crog4KO_33400 [Crocinitomicaceae bacterium]
MNFILNGSDRYSLVLNFIIVEIMKIKMLLFASLAFTQFSIAQVEVDSSFTVRDTLTVEDDARVGHNLEVDENALIRHDLEVDGATEMQDVIIYGTTQMKALQEIDNTDFGILVAKSDGTVMKSGPGALFPVPQDPVGICDVQGGYSSNPYWISEPNKLYAICPDIKVGIRESNPLSALHVNGDSYFTQNIGIGIQPDADAQLAASTTRKVGICINHDSSEDYGYAYKAIVNSPTTKGIGIFNEQYGKDIFTVYADGKVEVSNQTGRIWQLESDGLMRGRQIKLDTDTWADYVFDEDYELMPLDEVEIYISEESHLPNVPSQEEVLEEGVDLGEMNVILLEKVEELTLYLIEQNKKIEQLEEELKELQGSHEQDSNDK